MTHVGDGLYVEFDGFGLNLRVNDHRNPVVAYIDGPLVLKSIVEFYEKQSGTKLEDLR